MDQQIEQKIVERGQEFFNSISGEPVHPSIRLGGTGKVMDWSMKNEDFKVQLFRFVDVLPYLTPRNPCCGISASISPPAAPKCPHACAGARGKPGSAAR